MHYIVLYPQNGDRIVTTDSVTSLLSMYIKHETQTRGKYSEKKR